MSRRNDYVSSSFKKFEVFWRDFVDRHCKERSVFARFSQLNSKPSECRLGLKVAARIIPSLPGVATATTTATRCVIAIESDPHDDICIAMQACSRLVTVTGIARRIIRVPEK